MIQQLQQQQQALQAQQQQQQQLQQLQQLLLLGSQDPSMSMLAAAQQVYLMQMLSNPQVLQQMLRQMQGGSDPTAALAALCGGMPAAAPVAPSVATDEDEAPLYVNAKQYHRILKRRQQRAKLEAENKIPKGRKPYLHSSRHEHAKSRERSSGGRFGPKNASTVDSPNAFAPSPSMAFSNEAPQASSPAAPALNPQTHEPPS